MAVAMVAATCAVLSAYAVRVSRLGRPVNPRLDAERGTLLLGRYPIEAFHWALSGMGRGISKTSVSPMRSPTSRWSCRSRRSLSSRLGILRSVARCSRWARHSTRSTASSLAGVVSPSDAGEMLDAMVDRYADAACLIGLVFFYRHDLPLAIALASPWWLDDGQLCARQGRDLPPLAATRDHASP